VGEQLAYRAGVHRVRSAVPVDVGQRRPDRGHLARSNSVGLTAPEAVGPECDELRT